MTQRTRSDRWSALQCPRSRRWNIIAGAANNCLCRDAERAHSLLSLRKISENGQKSSCREQEKPSLPPPGSRWRRLGVCERDISKCFILLRSRALGKKEKGWSAVKSGIYCAINSTWSRWEINYIYENANCVVVRRVTMGEGGAQIGMEKRQKWVSTLRQPARTGKTLARPHQTVTPIFFLHIVLTNKFIAF